jgi:hypothetical protein
MCAFMCALNAYPIPLSLFTHGEAISLATARLRYFQVEIFSEAFHIWTGVGRSAFQGVRNGMVWLIDRQVGAAWELYRGEQSPALVTWRVGDVDAPGS